MEGGVTWRSHTELGAHVRTSRCSVTHCHGGASMNWQCLIVRGFRNWPSTLHNAMHSWFAQEVKTFCKRCYCSEKTRSMDFTFEWFNGLLPIPEQLGSLKKTTFHSSISISQLTHIQGFFRIFSNLNQNLKLQHCSRFPYMATIITLLSSCSQEIVYSFSIYSFIS